jgi:WD40-like Beta Propeller Repeat
MERSLDTGSSPITICNKGEIDVNTLRLLVTLTAVAGASPALALHATAAPSHGAGVHATGVVNGLIAFTQHSSGNVYTANPDGTHVRLLVKHTANGYWSHDGTRVALPAGISGGRIGTATVSADGSHYKLLAIKDRTLQYGCFLWSPDARTLACDVWDDKHSGRSGVYTLSAADRGLPKRLTTNPFGNGHDSPGAFSPDGKRLLFGRFDMADNGSGLYVLTLRSKSVRRITPAGTYLQGGNTGDWSPSGDQIVFSEHVGGTMMSAPGSIWVIGADGRHPRHIRIRLPGLGSCGEPGMGCHEPRWSPDGKKIVFIGASLQGTDVYIANRDGTHVKQITHEGSNDDASWGVHPAWK